MESEARKFLDLDIVAERIQHDGDREMFREAVKCYYVESHRAATTLIWSTTADCLQRRIEEWPVKETKLRRTHWWCLLQ